MIKIYWQIRNHTQPGNMIEASIEKKYWIKSLIGPFFTILALMISSNEISLIASTYFIAKILSAFFTLSISFSHLFFNVYLYFYI